MLIPILYSELLAFTGVLLTRNHPSKHQHLIFVLVILAAGVGGTLTTTILHAGLLSG
ncbi:MAG: hypothetical protein ACFFDU_06265 [Candidatus Thorarchaeota archaeon]